MTIFQIKRREKGNSGTTFQTEREGKMYIHMHTYMRWVTPISNYRHMGRNGSNTIQSAHTRSLIKTTEANGLLRDIMYNGIPQGSIGYTCIKALSHLMRPQHA